MTPKSLLRHPACVSTAADLSEGVLHSVLDDPRRQALSAPRRLVFCSGKVYYDLDAARTERSQNDVALVRLEQLYPFPTDEIAALIEDFADVDDWVWVQEEPSNMGGWSFVRERLEPLLGERGTLRYVGRPRSASPATGSASRHAREQERLVRCALEKTESGVRT